MNSRGAVLPLPITRALDYPRFHVIKLEIFSAFGKQTFFNKFVLTFKTLVFIPQQLETPAASFYRTYWADFHNGAKLSSLQCTSFVGKFLSFV